MGRTQPPPTPPTHPTNPMKQQHPKQAKHPRQPLRVDINPIVVEPARWNAKKPEPFIAQLRGRPLVEIPLRRT